MCGQDILQPWGKPYCYMEVSGLTSSRASHSFDEQSVHRIAGGQELLGKKAGQSERYPVEFLSAALFLVQVKAPTTKFDHVFVLPLPTIKMDKACAKNCCRQRDRGMQRVAGNRRRHQRPE